MIKMLRILIFSHILLFASFGVYGQNQILKKYRRALENYILTGHETKWHNCDILSADGYTYDGVGQITMPLDNIRQIDMKSTFSSSPCLLINYEVRSKTNLFTLLKFGWRAVNHERLALVLKLTSGISLEVAKNTSYLPYLVAGEADNGREQFLCPSVGHIKPLLVSKMCSPLYLNYKYKAIIIGLLGVTPDLALTSAGVDGTQIRLIKIMSERLKFQPHIKIPDSFEKHANKVCQTQKRTNKLII